MKKILVLVSGLDKLKSIRNFLEDASMEISGLNDTDLLEDMLDSENYHSVLLDFDLIKDSYEHWLEIITREKKNRGSPASVLVILQKESASMEEKLLMAGANGCVIDHGDLERLPEDILEWLNKTFASSTAKEKDFSVADLEGKPERRKNWREMMDQVAEMSSKLEEALIRETKLRQELEEAITHVKTLSGLLPICANCKKIRDDTGYWKGVENYIEAHSEAEFTHSVCPECLKKLYPELY